jgi:DNA transposition AAA+ family ATPase
VKRGFISTENARRAMGGIASLTSRGAREACLLVLDGPPGTAKTETMTWLSVQHNWPMIRAGVQWKPRTIVSKFCEVLAIPAPSDFHGCFAALVNELSKLDAAAESRGKAFAIIIDEADHLARHHELIECVRDLSDLTNVITVLVGMGRLIGLLTKYPQISSRVGQRVEFRPASLADVQAMAAGLCEVPIAPDLIEHLHQQTGGLHREIMDGLGRIEAHGRLNPGQPVTRANMARRPLIIDRKTGKSIEVEP